MSPTATRTRTFRPVGQPKRTSPQPQPSTRRNRAATGHRSIPRTTGGWEQYRYTDGPLTANRTRPRAVKSPAWRHAIQDRAQTRRIPWLGAFGVATTSALSWGVTSLFGTIDVAPLIPALAVSTTPIVIGSIAACQARPRVGRWWPDLTAAMLGGAGLTFWVGMAGPSWWAALVLLIATVACGIRWWAAHPVGPDVPSLKPEPAPTPQEPVAPTAAPQEDVDVYAQRWDERIAAGRDAKLPGSRLTARTDRGESVHYRVELRSDYTFDDLRSNETRIAGMLDMPRKRVLFQPGSSDEPPSVAYLTIVTGDPVSGVRYYTGPTVAGGEITNLARFEDGSGELSISMWNEDGTKSVAVVGGMGGGKSAAANQLITGALSTGAMNLLYIDPKGNSSTALRKRARVVLLGQEAAMRAPELVQALNTARGDYAMSTEQDVLLPSRTEPGWTVMHDEFMAVSGDSKVRAAWARMSNQMRAYGTWMITANQALQESKWGDDATRSALTQQVIAFRINSGSDTLLPGMTYRPNDLPVDGNGNTIPGHATQVGVARPNVPALWDKLPRDGDTRDPQAPYTISTAFDVFFDQPEPLASDRAAIESILGPPNSEGRWVVGGPGATHRFPTEEEMKAAKKKAGKARPRKSDGFGLALEEPAEQAAESDTESDLTQVQADVLAIVEGGTEQAGEIVEAVTASRSAVNDALSTLSARGLIERYDRGRYRRS